MDLKYRPYLYAKQGDECDDSYFYKDAVQHLDRTLELTKKDKELSHVANIVYFARGYVRAKMGDYYAAILDFKKVQRTNPNDIKVKRNLSRLKNLLRKRKIRYSVYAFTILVGAASFLAFFGVVWLFWQNRINDAQYGYIALGFLALSLVTLYFPEISKFKAGPVELELGAIKALPANPKFEI